MVDKVLLIVAGAVVVGLAGYGAIKLVKECIKYCRERKMK